ncbi:hypothetical protein ACFLYA_02915 [Candidatus Dependentiae bacterium]
MQKTSNVDFTDPDQPYNLTPAVIISVFKKRAQEKKPTTLCQYYKDEGYVDLLGNNKIKCRNCEETYVRNNKGAGRNLKKHIENCYGFTVRKKGESFDMIQFSFRPPQKIRLSAEDCLERGHFTEECNVYNSLKECHEKKFKCAYCSEIYNGKYKKSHLVHCHKVDVEKGKEEQDFSILENVKNVTLKRKRSLRQASPYAKASEDRQDGRDWEDDDLQPKKKRRKKRSKIADFNECLQKRGYVKILSDTEFKCRDCKRRLNGGQSNFSLRSHVELCYGVTLKETKKGFVLIKFSSEPPYGMRLTKKEYFERGHLTKEFKPRRGSTKKIFECAYCFKKYCASNRKTHLACYHKVDIGKKIEEQDFSMLRKVKKEVLDMYQHKSGQKKQDQENIQYQNQETDNDFLAHDGIFGHQPENLSMFGDNFLEDYTLNSDFMGNSDFIVNHGYTQQNYFSGGGFFS